MRTEYACVKLVLQDTVRAKPLFYCSSEKKTYEVTEGFKYIMYPSLWIRTENMNHEVIYKKALLGKINNFIYKIKTDLRGLYA